MCLQIIHVKPFNFDMQNLIVWNRTVFTFNCAFVLEISEPFIFKKAQGCLYILIVYSIYTNEKDLALNDQ